jgi:hypothetical protein
MNIILFHVHGPSPVKFIYSKLFIECHGIRRLTKYIRSQLSPSSVLTTIVSNLCHVTCCSASGQHPNPKLSFYTHYSMIKDSFSQVRHRL